MRQAEKMVDMQPSPASRTVVQVPDDFEIGTLSTARARVASEIGAAMAHEFNGPMTALLLYLGDIHQHSDRLVNATGDTVPLKVVIDGAFREAERICSLIHRMGDSFEAMTPPEAAVASARDAIAWWSRAGGPCNTAPSSAGLRRAAATPLTPREQEVLGLVSEGHSNKEGAMVMKISHRTFECHRAEVMRKLGARNAADLVRIALLETTASSAARG
jgi:DNA-binding CsgD family transcriptional regulator